MSIRTTVLLVAALGLSLTACGTEDGTTVDTKPQAEASPSAVGSPEGANAADAPRDEATTGGPLGQGVSTVGDTISLKGAEDGEELDVTLVKWLDPAKSADRHTIPTFGKRWVAAQIRLVNTGSATYRDSPPDCVRVADAEGRRYDATVADIAAGSSMATELKLAKGDKAVGWVVAEVPKGAAVTSLQFIASGGAADETGQWAVREG
ncbi:DUF4352 domain-containing protein [Streptomyces sp. NA02950]|uniref:DUF4352 domain-containing protein n=1 Tax=Streptomyces sp. NA02950 TaxID=2742137 RepID=UPI001591739E|nr:DUF4352 domain-containing protein [Streptomyces sp. NA02950]QKV96640.1 DUF4352 domain-containing protein [Streptomyces sp. NA02950]